MQWLLRTPDDKVATLLRLVLAVVIYPHGAQKALGWFGGPGVQGFVGWLGSMGIPAPLAYLAIAAEFLGSFALALGFLTRLAALGIAVNMAVAIALVHWNVGFFMNWSGQLKGEGYEFHLLVIGIALALVLRGGGAWSVDRALAGRS